MNSYREQAEWLRNFAFEFGADGGDSAPLEQAAGAIDCLSEHVEILRLTAQERDDIQEWIDECLRRAFAATPTDSKLSEQWQSKAKRAAGILSRHW